MREKPEVHEAKEVEDKSGGVAAFFDLDGTLLGLPSMEKRFFSALRYRRVIGIRNAWRWITEAARLGPRGINLILHANKMYLRGVCVSEQESLSLPAFFPEAVERVAWHAERGHNIVIISGTLQPLAEHAALALEAELVARGLVTRIGVCATRLEERGERWTGRIVGEAMFGEAKAWAIRRLAAESNLELERCYAYGDSASDRWMLEAVGKSAAVNPSHDLARIAWRNDWPVLSWAEQKELAQSARRSQRALRRKEAEITERMDVPEEIDRRTLAAGVRTEHRT